jgi:hypothetical protein
VKELAGYENNEQDKSMLESFLHIEQSELIIIASKLSQSRKKEAKVLETLLEGYLKTLKLSALTFVFTQSVLGELGLEALPFEGYATLGSEIASYNGLVLMSAFVAVFVLILLFMLSLRSKAKEAKDRFDIAYCGEIPNEGTHLHYGFSMGKELRRVGFIGVILKNSSSAFYDFIARQLFGFATILRKIYSGNLSFNFNIAALFALVLLWWGLR